jgi:cytochrome bd ubiquinol oxidase subunit II
MTELTPLQHVLANGWWVAVAFCVLAYIILDGADLGAGIFSLFVVDKDERGAIMQAMAGTWDANETWLIVAGGVLFGSFPFAYGSVLSYLMIPLMLVLWGILTRAVALEYRHLAEGWSQRFTDYAFGFSSLTTTFFGGMSVGAVLHGFPLTHVPDQVPTYVGGALRFVSPFSVWTGVAAVIAVSLSGGLFIRARFERGEPIRKKAAGWTNRAFYLVLLAVLVTVVWSVLEFPWASNNWLGHYFWVWGLFLLAAVASTFMMRRASTHDRDFHALLWLDLTIAIMAGGMFATLYPDMVPGTWTVAAAASPEISLFTFVLTLVFLFPVMIMYNWYQIWVFRARVAKLASYHT